MSLKLSDEDAWLDEPDDAIAAELLYHQAFFRAAEVDRSGSFPNIFEGGVDLAASALLSIALSAELDPMEVLALKNIYDALTVRGAFQLKLANAKSGKSRSNEQRVRRSQADKLMFLYVELMTKKQGNRESAVAKIKEKRRFARGHIRQNGAGKESARGRSKSQINARISIRKRSTKSKNIGISQKSLDRNSWANPAHSA